jgi:hypothetical protein
VFVDFDFDGQAVAIESWNVGGIEAGHGFGFNDEIFEAFIEGVAEVDGSVGIGWAVVEDVRRMSYTSFAQLVIKAHGGPASQAKWFILR